MPQDTNKNSTYQITKGSIDYRYMIDKWILLEDVSKGSIAIDAKKTTYLKQYVAESDEAFKRRQETSFFENYFVRAVRDISSLPFSAPIKAPEKQSAELEKFLDDVDDYGSSLTEFAQSIFENSLTFGVCGVLVDHPKVPQTDTLSEDARRKPKFVLFEPKNILGIFTEEFLGEKIITRLWLKTQNYVVSDASAGQVDERLEETITEFILGRLTTTEEGITFYDTNVDAVTVNEYSINSSGEAVLVGFSELNLKRIPFRTFTISNTISELSLRVEPVLYDLAISNLSYYNKRSDHNNILKVSRFPMLTVSGLATETELNNVSKIGPNKVLYTKNPDGKFYWLEHSGKTIEVGMKDSQELKDDMLKYAPEFQNRVSVHPTATQIQSEDKKAGSYIRSLTIRLDTLLKTLVNMALEYRGEQLAEDDQFEIYKDFTISDVKLNKVKFLLELSNAKKISDKTFLNLLKKYEIFNEKFDVDQELKDIEDQLTNEIDRFERDEALNNDASDNDDDNSDDDDDNDE